MKYGKKETEYALESLRSILKIGDTVYTKLNHVSKSGMSRSIDVYKIENNEPIFLTQWASRVLGDSIDQKNGGIRVTGCGMDMGFDLVYRLGWKLFKDSKELTKKDAGYALNQRWL